MQGWQIFSPTGIFLGCVEAMKYYLSLVLLGSYLEISPCADKTQGSYLQQIQSIWFSVELLSCSSVLFKGRDRNLDLFFTCNFSSTMLKMLFFSNVYFWHFCQKQVGIVVYIPNCVSHSIILMHVSVFVQVLWCLYYSHSLYFQISCGDTLIFFSIAFVILLYFHIF